jgi:hypothetical protein
MTDQLPECLQRWGPLVVGVVGVILAAITFRTARNQRRLENAAKEPGVQALINRTPSIDGWRSVQLHLTPPKDSAAFSFGKTGWRIVNAELRWPRNAELAFAKDNDASMAGPIAALSPRLISGRINHAQPFAMEFFIRFPGTPHADRGKRARFRVNIGHTEDHNLRRIMDTWAEVPVMLRPSAPLRSRLSDHALIYWAAARVLARGGLRLGVFATGE